MADLNCDWGDDFSLTPDGDLALIDGSDLTRQHIVRRLYTAVRGNVWHPEYGAGLPQRIGRVAQPKVIESIVRSQIALEATVAQIPVPKISVTAAATSPGLFVILIAYTDAVTGRAIEMRLETPGA